MSSVSAGLCAVSEAVVLHYPLRLGSPVSTTVEKLLLPWDSMCSAMHLCIPLICVHTFQPHHLPLTSAATLQALRIHCGNAYLILHQFALLGSLLAQIIFRILSMTTEYLTGILGGITLNL